MKRKLIIIMLLLAVSGYLFASDPINSVKVQTNYQINTIFQISTYPFIGTGGTDKLRTTAIGFDIKTTKGPGFQGVFDLAVLIPYKSEYKPYPSDSYTEIMPMAFPIGLDILAGFGYLLDREQIAFLFSGGFHINSLFEGPNLLTVFGVGADVQSFVRFGRFVTGEIGFKFAFDFGGMQTFIPASYGFDGFPITYGVYTGLGINF